MASASRFVSDADPVGVFDGRPDAAATTPAAVAVPVAMKVRSLPVAGFVLDKLGGIGRPVDIGKIGARMRRGDLDQRLGDAGAGDLEADLDGLVVEPARAADHFGALQSFVEDFIGAAHGGEVFADGHLPAEGR